MEIEKYTITLLTETNADVLKQRFIDGEQVGKNWRRQYDNSVQGRVLLQNDIPEPQLSAILTVWGETPLMVDDNLEP